MAYPFIDFLNVGTKNITVGRNMEGAREGA